jgi:hypothetical protein
MPAKNHLSQNQKQRLIKLLKESDDNYVREKVLILLLINQYFGQFWERDAIDSSQKSQWNRNPKNRKKGIL